MDLRKLKTLIDLVADSTIAGNSSNNPFLTGPVTFVIPINGVTSSTQVDWATFHFGVCAQYVQACNVVVPEPGSLTLVGLAVERSVLRELEGLHRSLIVMHLEREPRSIKVLKEMIKVSVKNKKQK